MSLLNFVLMLFMLPVKHFELPCCWNVQHKYTIYPCVRDWVSEWVSELQHFGDDGHREFLLHSIIIGSKGTSSNVVLWCFEHGRTRTLSVGLGWTLWCKMWPDAKGHPRIFGTLHSTYYVLGHTRSFSGTPNSMVASFQHIMHNRHRQRGSENTEHF